MYLALRRLKGNPDGKEPIAFGGRWAYMMERESPATANRQGALAGEPFLHEEAGKSSGPTLTNGARYVEPASRGPGAVISTNTLDAYGRGRAGRVSLWELRPVDSST